MGEKVYTTSYLWTGNYQEDICTVRNDNNQYYHIDLNGNPIYKESAEEWFDVDSQKASEFKWT